MHSYVLFSWQSTTSYISVFSRYSVDWIFTPLGTDVEINMIDCIVRHVCSMNIASSAYRELKSRKSEIKKTIKVMEKSVDPIDIDRCCRADTICPKDSR
jgi:hypothetical protein